MYMHLATLLLAAVGLFETDTPRHHQHSHGDAVLAHPHDPVLQAEHVAMLDLVRAADATHKAQRDGTWSDARTWQGGQVPPAGATVLIPKGHVVTVDSIVDAILRAVRVDGTLRFDPDQNTSLTVDTLVVSPSGRLEMGTAEHPVAADKRAQILIADRGPIDTQWDPNLLSRGLISHGTVFMHGAPITPYVALARAPQKGDTKLVLSRPPNNWRKGDRLVVTGTQPGGSTDEEVTLQGVSGSEVAVSPLAYDHAVPVAGLSVYVANLSRNVVVRSQQERDLKRLGHVMFMHSPKVELAYVGFYRLGRSDKRVKANDPVLDEHGQLTPGTGENPRGRYAVHFHRTGTDRRTPAARVRGCAVADSLGWGFVNHSGHVEFDDNVAYNVTGAAFVTEAGDEIGAFRGNLAVHMPGSGEHTESRMKLHDFGHDGSGFWLQGPAVTVDNNIAAGAGHAGFEVYCDGLDQAGLGKTQFPAANLPDPSVAGSHATVEVQSLSIPSFSGNTAFGCQIGLRTWYHLIRVTPVWRPAQRPHSTIQNLTVWNSAEGIRYLYTNNITVRDSWLVGYHGLSSMGIFEGVESVANTVYQNVRVEGWGIGLFLSTQDNHTIQGGYFNDVIGIYVPFAYRGRTITIGTDVRFGTLPASPLLTAMEKSLGITQQYNIHLNGKLPMEWVGNLFDPNTIRYGDRQLFFREQAPDFIPFKEASTPADTIAAELLGLTNREIWDRYGLALGGALAPTDARAVAEVHGLLGEPATYPGAVMLSRSRAPSGRPYRLVCQDRKTGAKGSWGIDNLRPGWNLLTLTLNGTRRSFLVFGEARQPASK
jgi:hypothetical protein